MKSLEFIFSQAKEEILFDIITKIVPSNITSFSELHNFVDANYYGGFCDKNYKPSKDFKIENRVQDKLDKWIKSNEFKNQFKK